MPLGLSGLSLPALFGIFAVAAMLVWVAGTRLTHFVNGIAEQTGLGKAFTGMLLLGGITSLPEVAAVSTSAAIGNAPLAINNLLGTASVNLVLLAVADVIYGRGSLTAVAATPGTLMQGALSILLGAMVAMLATAGDVAIFGVGIGSTMLLLTSAAALWISSGFENRHVWEVVDRDHRLEPREERQKERPEKSWPLSKLIGGTVAAAAAILVGGFALSLSADAIAGETGIAAGMVGFILVGLATSLPEISSMTTAIRLREYDMAVGDIFGTNLFNFSLIFLADVIYRGEPVLNLSGTFEAMGAILAVILTGIFLIGLLERRSATVFRMGYDSAAALLVYLVAVAALAQIH